MDLYFQTMADHLPTKKDIAKYKEAFRSLDRDGNGSISIQELGTLLSSLGQAPTPAELEQIILEVDTDKSGNIEFEEFLVMMVHKENKGCDREEIEKAFGLFDSNGNGFISEAELRDVMHKLGEKLTDHQIDRMMTVADQDGDGRVGFEDFLALMTGNIPTD